jgi:hypothetical protein
VAFLAPDDEVLWRDSCAAEAPAREADTFEHECEAARAEIAALADHCVKSVTQRLREAWQRKAATPAPRGATSGTTSEETNVWPSDS